MVSYLVYLPISQFAYPGDLLFVQRGLVLRVIPESLGFPGSLPILQGNPYKQRR